MAEPQNRRTGSRSASDQPLVREVRWQLFRRDELPERLRRLQRLEDVADITPHRNGSGPDHAQEGR